VVLAAGRSERMGRPKALLPCGSGGESFLARIRATLRQAGIDEVRVVLSPALFGAAGVEDGEKVVNPDEGPMLVSVRLGLQALPHGVQAVLLWPVDHPLVSRRTVTQLVEARRRRNALLAAPIHGGHRGHPVLFSAALIPDLLGAPDNEGARAVVHAYQDDLLRVPVDDIGVLADIDTPEAYRAAFGHEVPTS